MAGMPLPVNLNLNDAFNNLGASDSTSSIGSYRSNNAFNGATSGLGLFKGTLIFVGVYLVLKLLKKGGK